MFNILDMITLCEITNNQKTSNTIDENIFLLKLYDIDIFILNDIKISISYSKFKNIIVFTFFMLGNNEYNTSIYPTIIDDDIFINDKLFKIYKKIDTTINRALSGFEGKGVVFNGFGVGGSLAILAGFFFSTKYTEKYFKVVSFANIKVGNNEFSMEFLKKISNCYQIMHWRDPVCYFQSHNLFKPISKHIFYLDRNNRIKYKEPSLTLWRFIKNYIWNDILYHSINKYKKEIKINKILYKLYI